MINKRHKSASIGTDKALTAFKEKSLISPVESLEEVNEKSAKEDVSLLSLGIRKEGGAQVITEKKDLEIRGKEASVDISRYMTGGGYTVDTAKLAMKRGHY